MTREDTLVRDGDVFEKKHKYCSYGQHAEGKMRRDREIDTLEGLSVHATASKSTDP